MRYIRLCIISCCHLPLAVPRQPRAKCINKASQLSGRVGMIEMDLASGHAC